MKTCYALPQLLFLTLFFFLSTVGWGQTTTINFETMGDGYTPSSTEGSGDTDVFNRTNPDIGGNSTYIWAVEDISLTNPSLTLDGINISGATSFTFSIDMLAHHFEDWDNSDALNITYNLDGGPEENLLWVRNAGGTFNEAASLDSDFDGVGDCVDVLPALTTGTSGCTVSANTFETFSTGSIALSGNSTLNITLQFFELTSDDEGIYLDNIVIDVTGTGGGNNCNLTASNLSNITCFDNGTPSDASDDYIEFDLDPSGHTCPK